MQWLKLHAPPSQPEAQPQPKPKPKRAYRRRPKADEAATAQPPATSSGSSVIAGQEQTAGQMPSNVELSDCAAILLSAVQHHVGKEQIRIEVSNPPTAQLGLCS